VVWKKKRVSEVDAPVVPSRAAAGGGRKPFHRGTRSVMGAIYCMFICGNLQPHAKLW